MKGAIFTLCIFSMLIHIGLGLHFRANPPAKKKIITEVARGEIKKRDLVENMREVTKQSYKQQANVFLEMISNKCMEDVDCYCEELLLEIETATSNYYVKILESLNDRDWETNNVFQTFI